MVHALPDGVTVVIVRQLVLIRSTPNKGARTPETLTAVGSSYVFDADIRDYNLWIQEDVPVILFLFDASRRQAYWNHVQGYFDADGARKPKKGAKTVRVHVPKRQPVNGSAVERICQLKWQMPTPRLGVRQ